MIYKLIDYMIDQYVFSMLQLYFAPYHILGKTDEVGRWVSSFTTNGLKWINICNPK